MSAVDILARLVPFDLRNHIFDQNDTAGTQLGFLKGVITYPQETSFLFMRFRSMAETIVHEIEEAMEAVVARG